LPRLGKGNLTPLASPWEGEARPPLSGKDVQSVPGPGTYVPPPVNVSHTKPGYALIGNEQRKGVARPSYCSELYDVRTIERHQRAARAVIGKGSRWDLDMGGCHGTPGPETGTREASAAYAKFTKGGTPSGVPFGGIPSPKFATLDMAPCEQALDSPGPVYYPAGGLGARGGGVHLPQQPRATMMAHDRTTELGASKDKTPAPGEYTVHGGVGQKDPYARGVHEGAMSSPPSSAIGTAKRKTLEGIVSDGGGPDVGPGSYATRGRHYKLVDEELHVGT
jgi:hypothetical protein